MEAYGDIQKTSDLLDDDLRAQIANVFGKLTEDLESVVYLWLSTQSGLDTCGATDYRMGLSMSSVSLSSRSR